MSIRLTVIVENISTVLLVYDRVQIQRATNEAMTGAELLTNLGVVNNNNAYITLSAGTTNYNAVDNDGTSVNWYQSRYYSSTVSGVYLAARSANSFSTVLHSTVLPSANLNSLTVSRAGDTSGDS